MAELRVGVLGPGGVGGLLAATLAHNGAEVTCLASESTVAALRTNGLSIMSDLFGTYRQPVRAETTLRTPVDVLCVAVKAMALVDSLDRVPLEMVKDAIVVPFLNGVEHVALLRERLFPARVIAATIRVESARHGAGEIIHKSPFAAVQLAPRPTEERGVTEFAALLTQAGFDVTVRDDEKAILWEKLSFLAPLALLTTAYDMPAGRVRTEHRRELEQVISEVTAVANAEGVPIEAGKVLAQFDGVPETMQSSMQRDAAAGQETEIESIGGAVVRAGEKSSIDLATIGRLVTLLRQGLPSST